MLRWIGAHHLSTWMIVASLVAMAGTAHPSMVTYLMLLLNAPWLFLMREVAHAEGRTGAVCKTCVFVSIATIAGAFVLLLSMRWLAI